MCNEFNCGKMIMLVGFEMKITYPSLFMMLGEAVWWSF